MLSHGTNSLVHERLNAWRPGQRAEPVLEGPARAQRSPHPCGGRPRLLVCFAVSIAAVAALGTNRETVAELLLFAFAFAFAFCVLRLRLCAAKVNADRRGPYK